MKVIDAHTGQEIKEGTQVTAPDGSWYRAVKIKPGVFSASMLVKSSNPLMNDRWLPLQVRWTHPKFPLQHVAFVPS